MKVFSIVESPIIGDPLAPLRMQASETAPSMDWRDILHYHITKNISPASYAQHEHTFQGFAPDAFDPKPGDLTNLARELSAIHDQNEDNTSVLSDDFLSGMTAEVESIMGNMPEGTQVFYVNSPEELADLLDKFNFG